MWAYPALTIVAIAGILAILVQMGLKDDTRSQLLLSLLSWAVALVGFALTRRFSRSHEPARETAET
jgi:GABA permease